ncbi:hypothetical protein VNO80_25975 [Phaseolus coccineus]|uniref:Uncharacterized protein n=1 Tax=Phaseolus coccineus TaxID=3886 RepID=A0AAN9LYS9_PHACN
MTLLGDHFATDHNHVTFGTSQSRITNVSPEPLKAGGARDAEYLVASLEDVQSNKAWAVNEVSVEEEYHDRL